MAHPEHLEQGPGSLEPTFPGQRWAAPGT